VGCDLVGKGGFVLGSASIKDKLGSGTERLVGQQMGRRGEGMQVVREVKTVERKEELRVTARQDFHNST